MPATPVATAATPSEPSVEQVAVELRDRLVASQETLLNRFRCRFDIDVYAVPSGYADRVPAIDPTEPAVFRGAPTRAEIAQRDHLIAAREALLNAYRCRFKIDTVPTGCPT